MDYLKSEEELYAMTSSEIMKLGRHFDWNKSRMQNEWIMADDRKRLVLRNKLGIDFD